MHWIYWKTAAGKHTHTPPYPRQTDDPVASSGCTEPSVLLINKGSRWNRLRIQRSGGFVVVGMRHVIKECCLCSCWISWATPNVSLRWKQDKSACMSCCADLERSSYIVSWTRWWWRVAREISVEKRVLGSTIWRQYPRTSFTPFLWLSPWHCLSSDTPLTCRLPVDTFTSELLSFSPLPHFHSCTRPLPLPPLYRPPHASTLPVWLIKMWQEKK